MSVTDYGGAYENFDQVVQKPFPGFAGNGTEPGGGWTETREVQGSLWQVANATYNGSLGGFQQVNPALGSTALAVAPSGSLTLYTAPAGASAPISWTATTIGAGGIGLWGIFVVTSYGADPTGAKDSTAAIQATINACVAAGGGVVLLPPGTFKISSALVITALAAGGNVSCSVLGSGSGATTIVQSSPTASIFSSASYPSGSNITNAFFRDFGVRYSSTPTAGSVFAFPWISISDISHVYAENCFNFVSFGLIGQTVATVAENWVHDVFVGEVYGCALNFGGYGGNVWVTDSFFGGSGQAGASVALRWNNAYYDVIWLSRLDFESFGTGFDFICNSTTQCGLADAFIENVILDAPNVYGFAISAAASGATFKRIKCRDLWITTGGTSAGPGLSIGSSNSGTIEDISIIGGNYSGSTGITLDNDGSAMSDVIVQDAEVYDSINGVVAVSCTNFTLQNCSIGTPYGGGVGVGIQISGSPTGQLITGNRVANYTTPFSIAAGAGSLVQGNLGVNPIGALATPTYGAATNTFPYQVRVNISGASTATIIDSASTGLNSGSFILLPGETITPGTGGAWTWSGL